jgi:hypothetical protein
MSTTKPAKSKHGGKRPGAGRKSRPFHIDPTLAKSIAATNPLDFLLQVMNDPNVSMHRRDQAARAALPFVHPRFASVEIGKKQQQQTEAENVASGDDGEWAGDLTFNPRKAN